MELQDINKWLERLRGESGIKIEKIRKPWHTDNPSIQGTWTPFINKPSLKM
jgi:large subunit ribosomal protein L43